MISFMREVSPEELGELAPGDPNWDPDYDCMKLRVISEKMQEEEKIAEKKKNHQFVDEPIQDPQGHFQRLIPKKNLRTPFKWFDYDSDAEKVFKAIARVNDVGVHYLGKSTMGRTLCRFLDVVFMHRDLRMEKEGDPPRMSLQDRRERHWRAVIAESCLARDFSLRLARHVTLMLVGASLDFANTNGIRTESSDLNRKIDKLSDWFGENDPKDVDSFEYFQPERQKLPEPRAQVGPRFSRRGRGNGVEKNRRNCKNRKRKAETHHPSSNFRQNRRVQPRPPLSPPRPNYEIELPE